MNSKLPRYLYRNISLELISQFPGSVFLRLEPWTGPVSFIEVAPGDIVNIGKLGDRGPGAEERVTRITASDLPAEISRIAAARAAYLGRHPEPADDDFQPGDSA